MNGGMGKRGKKPRRVRLEDIAAKVGVSLSTVSRALSGEKGVREDVRQRILDAARDANYALPKPVAGTKVVLAASSAAMIDYVRNQFTLYVLEGIRERAEAVGIEIVTRPVADAAEEQRVLEEARLDEEVAGLLFLTVDDERMLAATRDVGKPVVLINGDDPLMRLSSVTPCNRSAAQLATEYLIERGHERILFLMRPGRRTIVRRLEGWRDALAQHGLPHPEDLVMSVDDWLPELADQVISDRIGQRGLDFTAVLAAGESLAVGTMRALERAGYGVPADVSVMGMDDLPQAAFLSPPLTTVHIPAREIGMTGVDLLRDICAGSPALPRRVELACHIVERQSVAGRRQDKAEEA
ncbi:DNA-binding LacI/PurR family transcriptional regulator [Rhizobium flavum]|uniref:DNA-binding LacI/PurR family transcriptional regulator n=2 Tax=Pseudorhizobium flavum TaxID=1335061 RepID=A0A7W9YXM5_9HYPH|nr:LacI family DNA-binding transcriptional regulator [Pseudorhizobium flavum]MBB6180282.1 DNA-binding LacI/PurR family transcriptional regulator [Pseudorhizobium flavum]CAD6618069.1 LacI family transcriptional regulator [Pseudorhizobium flavum]